MFDESPPGSLTQRFQALCTAGVEGPLTDGELLDRFLEPGNDHRDAAFRALMNRHGGMVFRVCFQALRDRHAAEDAFQATFLVLARRASSIRRRESLGSWLFGVAARASAKLRTEQARRGRLERRYARITGKPPLAPNSSDGSWSEIHTAIDRLPEKYRLPIVLCYFVGLTHEQAASQLRWPVGTVKIRLTRAREQLRRQLARNAPCAAVLSGGLESVEPASAPQSLVSSTADVALGIGAGIRHSEAASDVVIRITKGVSRDMFINKLGKTAIVSLCLASVGLGGLAVAQHAASKAPLPRADPAVATGGGPASQSVLKVAGATAFNADAIARIRPQFDCRVDKVLVQLGAIVKKGDPLLELFSTDLAAAKNDYEVATSQWRRDKKFLDLRASQKGLVSDHTVMECENAELRSRLQMKVAREKLLLIGLNEAEIEKIPREEGAEKARSVFSSPASGLVIERSAVPGNFYDAKDTLLVIAQDDPLWVTASIPAGTIDTVALGRKLSVHFPMSDLTLGARIETIGSEVDPATQTVKIRASIPNPDHRLKAGMFVGVQLDAVARSEPPKRTSVEPQPPPLGSVEDRLNALEQKLDRLLAERVDHASNARFLERLIELERKVDQILQSGKHR
jgi:RNA polymerase sigma factor (sigma-70 family)